MGADITKELLGDFGLTQKEREVYIFLARHNILKCSEIAKGMRKHSSQVYRVLKILENKGLIEATLESPIRYSAIPIEKVIDLNIKAKQDEVARIQKGKEEILKYWGSLHRLPEGSPEKFQIIEGNQKIFSRITRMIREAKGKILVVAGATSLLRAEQFGVFDAISDDPSRGNIEFCFLTDVTLQNTSALKTFLKSASISGVEFKSRNSNTSLKLASQMVIRDNEEILYFMEPMADSRGTRDDVCLWTNCHSLVQAFVAVFNDMWENSTDLRRKIFETETGKLMPKSSIYSDLESARDMLKELIDSTKKEIIILTSANGIVRLAKDAPFAEKAKAVDSVRIMAPIVKQNFEAVSQLSSICEVRHVGGNYWETIVIDGSQLFESQSSIIGDKTVTDFASAIYSCDKECVKMMKEGLDCLWKNSTKISNVKLDSALISSGLPLLPLPPNHWLARQGTIVDIKPQGMISEQDVVRKIINAKWLDCPDPARNVSRMYASLAAALIHPPSEFKLPELIIGPVHVDKHSSFGEEDYIEILQPVGNNQTYVPVAFAGDNPDSREVMKEVLKGTPAAQNHILLSKKEIEIRIHGNTLFAAWSVPIPLYPKSCILPPACIQIEAYGAVKTVGYSMISAAGFRRDVEQNCFDAFVTLFHPVSKYTGPGTDAAFCRDYITTNYPPALSRSI